MKKTTLIRMLTLATIEAESTLRTELRNWLSRNIRHSAVPTYPEPRISSQR